MVCVYKRSTGFGRKEQTVVDYEGEFTFDHKQVTKLIVLAVALSSGCASGPRVPIELLKEPPCANASGVAWAGPKELQNRLRLSDWCRSVGPVVVKAPVVPAVDVAQSGLIVLTWNQHEGYGDVEGLLRAVASKSPVVALLQEVARAGDTVPLDPPTSVRLPGRIGPRQNTYRDIETIARELNMSLVYLPSMPNGHRTREDRGCAILSTLPVSDVLGIELPWVRQRRVAVMATVTAMEQGVPLRLRIVNMHLDNRSGRSRQAAAVADFLAQQAHSHLPMILGGDLNTLSGVEDQAVQEIHRVVPLASECGERRTLSLAGLFGLRLDHLFTNLPQEVRKRCYVEETRFGSDHHPIVLQLFKDENK